MQAFKRFVQTNHNPSNLVREITNEHGRFNYVAAWARSPSYYRVRFFRTLAEVRTEATPGSRFYPRRLAELRRWAKQDGCHLPA